MYSQCGSHYEADKPPANGSLFRASAAHSAKWPCTSCLALTVDVVPLPRFEDVFREPERKQGGGRGGSDRKYPGRLGARELRPSAAFRAPIVAETSVRIVHNLIAPPGVRVLANPPGLSHPVALNQCLRFFAPASANRAGAVLRYRRQRQDDHAGPADRRRRHRLRSPPRIYGAAILRRSIEDDRQNFTRFFLLRTGFARNLRSDDSPDSWKTRSYLRRATCRARCSGAGGVCAARSECHQDDRGRCGETIGIPFLPGFSGRLDAPASRNALNHLGQQADLLQILGCYPKGD